MNQLLIGILIGFDLIFGFDNNNKITASEKYIQTAVKTSLTNATKTDTDNKKKLSKKIPAFPGAEGAGMWSVGGRGGKVYEVTTLEDLDFSDPKNPKPTPGSLREAIEAKGPRIIIFRVAGYIDLDKRLVVKNPYLTIAGQTAPGQGITLRNWGLNIYADHVIVRYLRIRPGDNALKKCVNPKNRSQIAFSETDSLEILGKSKDVIIDHSSMSWSNDETLSIDGRDIDRITVQWNIIAEPLHKSTHCAGAVGYGSIIGGSKGAEYSFHHNLYAHTSARAPKLSNRLNSDRDGNNDQKGLLVDFSNNVVYNPGGAYPGGVTTCLYNGANRRNTAGSNIVKLNFINNYYKFGFNSRKQPALNRFIIYGENCPRSKTYFAGNAVVNPSHGKPIIPRDPWNLVYFNPKYLDSNDIKNIKQLNPFATKMNRNRTKNPVQAYQDVLNYAGATRPFRDSVDRRILEGVKNGTGKIINDEMESCDNPKDKSTCGWPTLLSGTPPIDSDRDGLPDDWEKKYGLNQNNPQDGNLDCDGDGYTNIEEYINQGPGKPCP
ncbi:MAG TPA: pectate lyase [Cyanothece sp. UBA12306]|nr:pectate lyase [Cyanothece sp. UBA12306]